MIKLQDKALLVQMKATTCPSSCTDKEATAELAHIKGADAKRVRVTKKLLVGGAYEDLTSFLNRVGRELRDMTVPWDRSGVQLLPIAMWAEFDKWKQDRMAAYQGLLLEFERQFDDLVTMSGSALSQLYDATDYPKSAAEAAGRFSLRITTSPVPDVNDLRSISDSEIAEAVQADVEAAQAEIIKAVDVELLQRIVSAVDRAAERLSKDPGPEGRFTNTLITDIEDIVRNVPRLNVSGNPVIADIVDKMAALSLYPASTVRENATLRKELADEAKTILGDASTALSAAQSARDYMF